MPPDPAKTLVFDSSSLSCFAWAEVHGAVAVLDDQTAVNNVGQQRSVAIKRTLGLISTGIQRAQISDEAAATLVDELTGGGARFPCDGRGFITWCRENGLLT